MSKDKLSLRSRAELNTRLKELGLEEWLGGHWSVMFDLDEIKTECNALWGGGELNLNDVADIILNGWITAVRERMARHPDSKYGQFNGNGIGVSVGGHYYSPRSYWSTFPNPSPNAEDVRVSNLLFDYAVNKVKALDKEYNDKKAAVKNRRLELKRRRERGEAGRGYRNVDRYGRDDVLSAYAEKTGRSAVDVGELVKWMYDDYRKWEG